MQYSNAPSKLTLPFANAGTKNTIPVASQIGVTPGAASFTDGFPPLTMTPISAGGVPPFGQDFNGIFYTLSAMTRWLNAGGTFKYDGTFSADANVGGYPAGAILARSDSTGFWVSTADNNTTDPEGVSAANWLPVMSIGNTSVALSNANVTLTNLQAAKQLLTLSGTLTANVQVIVPAWAGMQWVVENNTTGAFTVTIKTAAGTGIVLGAGDTSVYCNGTNIEYSSINATTQAAGDNSTKIATTAFVSALVGGTTTATSSLAANGYQKLPSGLIIQWGAASLTLNVDTTITFPIAFPTAVRSVLLTTAYTNGAGVINGLSAASSAPTLSNFVARNNTASTTVYWFAIGY